MFTEIFERLFKAAFGWEVKEFYYYNGNGTYNTNLAFSSTTTVLAITFIYFTSVYGLGIYMKTRKAINLKPLFAVHNVILSFFSLVLLILMMETLIPIIYNKGLFFAICDHGMFTSDWGRRLELFYYINYLFKFYELVDTYFMVLSKKNIEFLHIYHHSATFWLCYTQLVGNTSVQWFVITFNLFVHVVMYYYYARAAMGANIWWKKYLTTLQIVQFVCDLFFCYYCTWVHYGGVYFPHIAGYNDCWGTPFAAAIGCGILTSYLGLFVQFFVNTYSARRNQQRKAVADAKKAK